MSRIQVATLTHTHARAHKNSGQNTTQLFLEFDSSTIVNKKQSVQKFHKMNYFHLIVGVIFIAFCVEKGKFAINFRIGAQHYDQFNGFVAKVYYLSESHCPFFFNERLICQQVRLNLSKQQVIIRMAKTNLYFLIEKGRNFLIKSFFKQVRV